MLRTRSLNPTVAVLLMVVVSLAVASVAGASSASPLTVAPQSYQLPVNSGERAVVREWMPHVVQSGESLFDIAASYGIPAPVLAHTNGISNFDNLSEGMVVWVPMVVVEVIAVAPSYVKATSSTFLYAGPAADYAIAAKMRAGEAAIVLGRSADGEWLQVSSASNASSRGWIKADSELFQMFTLPVAPR